MVKRNDHAKFLPARSGENLLLLKMLGTDVLGEVKRGSYGNCAAPESVGVVLDEAVMAFRPFAEEGSFF